MSAAITRELAGKVREVVDAGLCRGMGRPVPGEMCVEAAVCYAMGLPHSDEPLTCVGQAVRIYEITLNDADWPSNAERAAGLREIAVAQLGSNEIDQQKFSEIVCLETIRRILPISLRGIGLEKEAAACEQATDLKSAESAAALASWSAAELTAWSAAKLAESAAWSAAKSASWSAAKSAELAAESAAWSAAKSAELTAWSAAKLAAKSASWSAAKSAELTAWSAAKSAAELTAWSAESAAESKLSILRLAAQIGVEALRACNCPGVQFLD